MEENELLDMLGDLQTTGFIDKFIETKFYITEKEPVYTLKECLETAEDRIIELTYIHYFMNTKSAREIPSKSEMIAKLEKEIVQNFKEQMTNMMRSYKDIFKEVSEHKETKKCQSEMLVNGFLFGFKKNDSPIYIMPSELMNLYQEYIKSDEKKKEDLKFIDLYLTAYSVMNGVIPKKFIEETFIKDYQLNVRNEDIELVAKGQTVTYKNKYYSILSPEGKTNNKIDAIIEEKNKHSFLKLAENELLDYVFMVKHIIEELKKSLKKENKKLAEEIFFHSVLSPNSPENIVGKFQLSPNETKKIIEILKNHNNYFRYWILNGRTFEEFEREYAVENMVMSSIPKKTDTVSCLKQLPTDMYKEICKDYDTEDVTEVSKARVEEAKEIIKDYNEFQLKNLFIYNHSELDDYITRDEIMHGVVYLYQEDDKTKYLIPDEILEEMEVSIGENSSDPLEDIVSEYINMNGIIERTKLKELLEEYHGIDISIKELDKIVKELGAFIRDNKYYTWIGDINKSDMESILRIKEQFSKYKKLDMDYGLYENDFKEKLTNYLEIEFGSKADDLFSMLIITIKNGCFKEEMMDFIFEDADVVAKPKQKKEIWSLYQQYKKYISVWIFNGYTINENHAKQIKKEKIGRNDPCPCGSGKKYKKCCGK